LQTSQGNNGLIKDHDPDRVYLEHYDGGTCQFNTGDLHPGAHPVHDLFCAQPWWQGSGHR